MVTNVSIDNCQLMFVSKQFMSQFKPISFNFFSYQNFYFFIKVTFIDLWKKKSRVGYTSLTIAWRNTTQLEWNWNEERHVASSREACAARCRARCIRKAVVKALMNFDFRSPFCVRFIIKGALIAREIVTTKGKGRCWRVNRERERERAAIFLFWLHTFMTSDDDGGSVGDVVRELGKSCRERERGAWRRQGREREAAMHKWTHYQTSWERFTLGWFVHAVGISHFRARPTHKYIYIYINISTPSGVFFFIYSTTQRGTHRHRRRISYKIVNACTYCPLNQKVLRVTPKLD